MNVAVANPAHIMTLMNRQCAAELTLVQSLSHSEPLSYPALLHAFPPSPALVEVQADIRLALFECSVLHTTRARASSTTSIVADTSAFSTTANLPKAKTKTTPVKSGVSLLAPSRSGISLTNTAPSLLPDDDFEEERKAFIFISEPEFAARATRGAFLAWVTHEDDVHYGVESPLCTWRIIDLPSRLHTYLRRLMASAIVITLPACSTPSRSLKFRLVALASSRHLILDFMPSLELQKMHTVMYKENDLKGNAMSRNSTEGASKGHATEICEEPSSLASMGPHSFSTQNAISTVESNLLQQGMVLEDVNGESAGTDVRALMAQLQRSEPQRLTLRHSFDLIITAYARPVSEK